jgi:hypothetical protein
MPLNSFQAGEIFQPVPPALLAQLTAIYLFRGKQELYERQAPEVLASLRRSAIIQRIVEHTRDSYYASLRASSEGWHSGRHSIQPWLEYFLGIVLAAYRELDQRLGTASVPTKSGRVRLAIEQLPEQFTVAEVERACPGLSRATIKLAMKGMRVEGLIEVARGGRHAIWRKCAQER